MHGITAYAAHIFRLRHMGVPKIRATSRAFCNKEPKNVSNSLTVFNGRGGRVYPTVEIEKCVPNCWGDMEVDVPVFPNVV
jgi:hypothetical protein